MNTNRERRIDIIKALGIILMVMGHSNAPMTRWIYLFHMALFFIVTGYCINDRSSESLTAVYSTIKRKVFALYMPCLLFNLIVVLLHNSLHSLFLIAGDVYDINEIFIRLIKCFFFSGGEQISGAMWFLRTMFIALVLYYGIDFFCRKNMPLSCEKIKTAIFAVLLIISWLCPANIREYKYLNCLTVYNGSVVKTKYSTFYNELTCMLRRRRLSLSRLPC